MSLTMLVLPPNERYSHVPYFLSQENVCLHTNIKGKPWTVLSFVLAEMTLSLPFFLFSDLSQRQWGLFHCNIGKHSLWLSFGITWQWTKHDEMWFDRAPELTQGPLATGSRGDHVVGTQFVLSTLEEGSYLWIIFRSYQWIYSRILRKEISCFFFKNHFFYFSSVKWNQ